MTTFSSHASAKTIKTVYKFTLACGFLLFTSLAQAQQTNGLYSQYQQAITNDANFAAAMKRHEAVKQLENIANAALFPTLSATANAMHDIKTSTNTNNYSVSLGMNLQVEALYAMDVANATIVQSAQNLVATQQNLITQTLSRYFDVVKGQVDIESVDAQIRLSEKNLAIVKKQGELGLVTPLQIAEIENNAQQLILNRLQARQQLHVARNTLALSTGVYSQTNLPSLTGQFVLPSASSFTLDYWWNLAQTNNASLQAQRFGVEKGHHNYKKSNASILPTARIAYNHLSQSNDNITLSITGNIYDSGLKSAQSMQAKLNWQADQQALQATTDSIRRQIDNTLVSLNNSTEQTALLESVLASAKNTLAATEQEYKLGIKDALDVLEAEQKIATNNANLIKARYDHLLLQVNLKQLAGTLNEQDLLAIDAQLR